MIFRGLAWLGLGAALVAAPARSQQPLPMVCTPSERHICSMGAGCQNGGSNTYLIVDAGARTLARCGGPTPCDVYPATFTMSGQTLNVEIPGRAAFLKLLPTGAFVDVATQGTVTILNYGYCQTQPPSAG